ncbi:MAG: hypothetical protein WCP52_11320 [Bacteroidota bacterium]
MTTALIRKKIHQYVDEADNSILEVVFKMLEVYQKSNTSLLSDEQQQYAVKTSKLYKEGKIKGYSLKETRGKVQKRIADKGND